MYYSIILLSLVAFCYSVPIPSGNTKRISLDENDTITITGIQGKKVVISRTQESSGDRNVEIYIEDNSEPMVKAWFKDQSIKMDTERDSQKSMTEDDILVMIFKKHQGDIDDETYEMILEKIHQFVRTGEVDVNVWNILKSFDSEEDQENSSVGISGTLNSGSLRRLLAILNNLGINTDVIDIFRLIRRDPFFINRLLSQDPSKINRADMMFLYNIARSQMTPLDLFTLKNKQDMMDLQDPMLTQDASLTQKDIMDMQLMAQMQMQDPRFKQIFTRPSLMTGSENMIPDMDTSMRMGYGMDMMSPSNEQTMMSEMIPTMLDNNMTTRQKMLLMKQMEQKEMKKRLQERMLWQLVMQRRNRLLNRRMFNTSPTMMNQENQMMGEMDRMIPMM